MAADLKTGETVITVANGCKRPAMTWERNFGAHMIFIPILFKFWASNPTTSW
jgi:hypothetical protein